MPALLDPPASTSVSLTAQADDLARRAPAPGWVGDLRRRGIAHFDRVGLPTSKHEEWRLTDIRPVARTAYALADTPPGSVTADDLRPFVIPGLDAHTLVFVDGRFAPDLSNDHPLPHGIVASSLAHAIAHRADLVRPHLGEYVPAEYGAFAAINAAYLEDGGFLHVPPGAALDQPIHLLFVTTDSDTPTMTHPRTLIVVGEDAKADVIEHHVGLGDRPCFTNAVTEYVASDRSRASHTFIERDGLGTYNVSTLRIQQGAHTDFTSHTLLLGGHIVRNNIHPVIAGADALSLLNGLYLPDGKRTMDNHMLVHHQQPEGRSRQFYTGLLRDSSTGVFAGLIKVDRAAQQTDAVQSSRNLLMSDDAHAHNRPQLEIFADDVKCTHGSTTGQLDEASVFYLRSRGVPEEIARGMLIYAFANESLDRIQSEAVRMELARLLVQQLGLGDEVAGLIE